MRADALAAGDLEEIATLRHFPGNARLHDEDLIRESLAVNGQYKPIIVQTSTRCVLAGNGTMAAAHALGWTEILVQWIDCDDEAARRINLVDNRASDKARDDLGELAMLLTALGDDLAGTGFTHDDLDGIRTFLDEPLVLLPDDRPTDPTANTTTTHTCPSCGHTF